MSKWSYNSVINTLTYLDVSSANAKLRRIENQLNQPVIDPQADREARAYTANLELEKIFDKLLARDRNMVRDGSAREYLETEMLALEVVDHDPEDFDRPNYAAKVAHLREDIFYRRNTLHKRFGSEGERYMEDLLRLPFLINETKKSYVFEEASGAQKGAWALGRAGVLLYLIGMVAVAFALWLPGNWDGAFLDVMDGNASYSLAPMLMFAGLGVITATATIRFLARSRMSAVIAAAKRKVGYEAPVELMRGEAAKERARYSASPFSSNTLSRHSFPVTTQAEKLAGLEILERQLVEAQRWLDAH